MLLSNTNQILVHHAGERAVLWRPYTGASVRIMPHGHHFTWFPYAADERARHVCLAPVCATPMCAGECGDIAACAGRMSVAQVEAAVAEIAGEEAG